MHAHGLRLMDPGGEPVAEVLFLDWTSPPGRHHKEDLNNRRAIALVVGIIESLYVSKEIDSGDTSTIPILSQDILVTARGPGEEYGFQKYNRKLAVVEVSQKLEFVEDGLHWMDPAEIRFQNCFLHLDRRKGESSCIVQELHLP